MTEILIQAYIFLGVGIAIGLAIGFILGSIFEHGKENEK